MNSQEIKSDFNSKMLNFNMDFTSSGTFWKFEKITIRWIALFPFLIIEARMYYRTTVGYSSAVNVPNAFNVDIAEDLPTSAVAVPRTFTPVESILKENILEMRPILCSPDTDGFNYKDWLHNRNKITWLNRGGYHWNHIRNCTNKKCNYQRSSTTIPLQKKTF